MLLTVLGCSAVSYPKFRVELPAIGMSETAHYSFRVEECPAADYLLRLVPEEDGNPVTLEDWSSVWDELRMRGITIGVAIHDLEKATEISSCDGQMPGTWGPAAWGEERFFYADACSQIRMPGAAVEFDISVAVDRPASSALKLKPVLVGGGAKE